MVIFLCNKGLSNNKKKRMFKETSVFFIPYFFYPFEMRLLVVRLPLDIGTFRN